MKDKSSKNFSFFIQRIPNYILWLLSFLFVRSKRKWCFGSQTGFLGSNPAYLLFDMISKHSEISVAWITDDIDIYEMLDKNNISVYKKWSLKGLWYCLTSKVYVYSHGIGDVNFATSGNTFKVNLWHGIGFKKMEYLAQLKWVNKKNPLHRIIYPFYCVNHDLLLSSSDYISRWLKDCFRCSEDIMLYNYPPRCQTRHWDPDKTLDYISNYNPQLLPYVEMTKKHNRSFFYMPTYREKSHCSVLEESHFDIEKMNDVLKDNNDIMFVKFHPRDLTKSKDLPNMSNVVIIKDIIDPYLFFPYISVLITDYSSVYPEYLLYSNQILIFDFDKEQYEKDENGCYYDVDDFISAIHARTAEELLMIVKREIDYTIPNENVMTQQFWGRCGNEDITEQIISRIK